MNIKVPSGSVNNNRVYSSFVKDGFSNWNKARDRFKSHEKTDVHRQALTSVCNQKTTNVSCMISNQLSKERQDARFCLLKIFETIRFLAVQGLPLRGNIEENSNFIQALRLRSIDNSILLNWMQRSKYRWVSHDMMDEILSMMSLHVQRILVANISKQHFYAIMSDETTDSSRKEQMSLNFRTVDENLAIHENFLGFYDVPSTDSKTLFDVLKDVLLRFNLKFLNCRGQCYDGANNMSGDYTGLQTRVREEEARAYYTHCAGHNISLVALGSLMAIPEIADFLSVFKELITFIRASSKRMNIFKNIQLQTDDDSEEDEPNVSLKPFCPTRWTVRVISLKSVKSNYKEILNFCDFVGSDPKTSTDAGIKARGFAVYLRKFDTIMYLNIVIETLEQVEELNKSIQATNINFGSIIRRLDILRTSLNALRCDESFNDLWDQTLKESEIYKLDEPTVPRKRVPPKWLDSRSQTAHSPPTPQDRFRPIYFGVIDQALAGINSRFDSETYKILSKMENFALNKCSFDDIKEYLVSNGHCDFDIDRLILHRKIFFDVVENENPKPKVDSLTRIQIYLKGRDDIRMFASEYTKFIQLLLTSPQTVCISERSFSDLRRLKTYIRSQQTQRKTNDLALLHIHREIANEINLDEIMDEFINKNPVRRNAFALKSEIK